MGNNDEFSTGIDPTDEYGNAQGKLAMQKLKKQQEFHDLLSSAMSRNSNVTPTQAFAASALALLPIIVGKHYAGTAGASVGAKAGGLGSSSYLGGIQQGANEQKALDIFQAKRAASEIDDLTQQENSLARTNLYLQGQKELQDMKAQNRLATRPTVSATAKETDPLASSWLQKKLRGEQTTPEEDAVAAKDRGLVQTGATAARAFGGSKSSAPSKDTKSAITGALLGVKQLDSFLSRMNQVGTDRLTRPIAQAFPENEQAQIKQDLDFYAGVLQQSHERGIMTDKDLERYRNYFSIVPLDTPESVSRRLKDFQDTLKSRMDTYLKVAAASREDVGGLRKLVSEETLPGNLKGPATQIQNEGELSSRNIFKQALIKRGISPDRAEALTLQKYGG